MKPAFFPGLDRQGMGGRFSGRRRGCGEGFLMRWLEHARSFRDDILFLFCPYGRRREGFTGRWINNRRFFVRKWLTVGRRGIFGMFHTRILYPDYFRTNKIAFGIFLPGPTLYPPLHNAVDPPSSRFSALSSPRVFNTRADSATVALCTTPI